MGWIAKDLPTLVFMLIPGFVAASIFYTLTAHPKTSEFERLIQALIFTVILKILTNFLKNIFLFAGRWASLGRWTSEGELTWSVILAVPLGLSFVVLANQDLFHSRLRVWGFTTRTSYPSEWYGTFVREKRWVVLHLQGGRRLYGWPEEWPDQSDRGHFVVDQPEWLLENQERAPLYRVARIMIPAADVKMVEFLNNSGEIEQSPEEIERVDRLLLEDRGGREDGSQGTPTGTEPPEKV